MIKIKGLTKSFKTKNKNINVLDNIDLNIPDGEIFGIIGKSGQGKSTLLKCLNLLEKPDSGNIYIDDIDITKLDKEELRQSRHKIAMIFQNFNLLNSLTVYENVALPLKFRKIDNLVIKDKVNNLLSIVGLLQYKDSYPSKLSGGQKQRVGIARALSTDPKILLSDEATSSLDNENTNNILDLLETINYKLGVTIILVTHETNIVKKICDSVAVLDDGKIIESGKTLDVILHPKLNLTRKLILEEEIYKYLEQVQDFYKYDKKSNTYLLLISFIGAKTFEPFISRITNELGVMCNILRGELGHMKRMPFGQILIEVTANEEQLKNTFQLFKNLDIHCEVIT